MKIRRLLLTGITGLLLSGLPALAGPVANTLWFSGDPVIPPDWSNDATTSPAAITIWQEFTVSDPSGWDITDVYSIGQDFGNGTGEWSVRTGMAQGVAGTTIAGGTGSLTESGYDGRTLMDLNIGLLHLDPGNYWLEVAPDVGSITATAGTNAIGVTPTGSDSALRDWPQFNQNYIFIAQAPTYSEGVAGQVSAPEPTTWASLLLGMGAIALGKRRRAAR